MNKKSTDNQVNAFGFLVIVTIILLFLINPLKATNPIVSNFLVNLSSPVNTASEWDEYPEMVIEGNTIHLVWIEVSGGAGKIYYCRSLDLGKTWETPKMAAQIKEAVNNNMNPQTRKLAVDGNNVHITWCDMVSASNWASKIYYLRSTNGGNSFEPAKELTSKGGDGSFAGCHIKAAKGKVAIAFKGTPNAKNGLFSLFSSDNGNVFNEKLISTEPTHLTDVWFDGDQLIIMWQKDNSSASTGNVSVSISNDNAASFITTNVSGSFSNRCLAYHDARYSPKIAKSGTTIHLVMGNYSGNYYPIYVRSTDNGQTFEKAIDINNGALDAGQGQNYQETLGAKNGQVYIAYLSKGSKVYFAQSADNGKTFSAAKNIMPEAIDWVQYTWYPSLVLDPSDASGNTVYFIGQSLFSAKSTDGGKTFSGYTREFPLVGSSVTHMTSDLLIDKNGKKHWISSVKFFGGSDRDIYYRNSPGEPNPGTKNKTLALSNVRGGKQETVIVPSSPSISFDVAMTGEALVKILPGSENELNVFGKVNGKDASSSEPAGFQLTFHNYVGKRYLNAGIETDKGKFVNWTGAIIGDTLWHHIAFTYNANAGLNNFKTYMDGLLVLEQTVTGTLKQGDGLFMIGSRNSFVGTNNYEIDNVRLWNRALTQDELMANQVKALTGKETGLKLFLNFDDTFKDISGNGNNAVSVNLGILKNSNFNPPVTDFELYQNMNQVTLTNKTQSGITYKWSFGDGVTSDKGNPVYVYPKAGEYKVILEATNENSKTALIKKVTIAGLDRIEPIQAGNGGFAILSVYGGGLVVDGTTLSLRKTGEQDIQGEKLASPGKGILAAYFNLNGKTIGKWDVVVKRAGTEQVLKEAFSIIKAELPDPWVSVSGRGVVLLNRWQTYTVSYGNNGNVDALGVPIIIAIPSSSEIEVEIIDFVVDPSSYVKEKYPKIIQARNADYFIWDDYFGSGINARVYAFVIPVVKAKSNQSLHIRIKSAGNFEIESWTGKPFYQTLQSTAKSIGTVSDDWPDEKTKLNACVAAAAMDAASNVASDLIGAVLPIDCAYDILTAIWNPWEAISPLEKKESTMDMVSGFGGALVTCAAEATGAELLVKGAKMIKDIYNGYQKNKECHEAFDPAYRSKLGVKGVSSFDPNEMIGPAGFGDKHWIQKSSSIPYTILFENKSTASAPAHDVFITDSLNLNKFDINDFGFGAFGFGDTTLVPNGNKLKQFSMDVDLRPKKNLITRVSGKLDTITGVVRWEFTSLNPTTLEYEEDPYIGFLPPNDSKRAGEGFVSFSVGLKKELKTNDALKNKASIVFDANAPIITNEFINTLDLDIPESKVLPLDATIDSRFPLNWGGTDIGSGIASYSVYVMENDTVLLPWKINTTLKTDEFIGKVGYKYKFYSIATDNVSLKETEPAVYDASTSVTVFADEFEFRKNEICVYPNPSHDLLNIKLDNPPCGMYVIELLDTNGKISYSELHSDTEILSGIAINVSNFNLGTYLIRIVFGNKVWIHKVLIK